MKKYWHIITNEIQRQFTYRASIAAYAFGNIAELVALAVIWTIVYRNIDFIKGYSANEMISYIVFAWFFSFLTTTYAFDFSTIILLLCMLIATYFINLFLSIIIGFIAFWTIEINGIYYSLKVFSKFMSGTFFPLALLPAFFIKASYFLP